MLVTTQNISFTTFTLNGFLALGEWRPILSIPYLLMFLLSTFSNSILIYLIISQRALHSPMCILIGLMAVVDLCLPIFFVPNMLLNFLFNWKGISLLGCLVQMFCIHVVGTFQSTILLWMALDRFFAICRPLYYHTYMEMPNCLKFIVFPVIRNVLLIMIIVSWAGKLSFCAKNEIDHCFCEHMALVQLACGDISINNILGLLAIFLITTTDVFLVIISYLSILSYVLKTGKGSVKAINTCITHIIVMTVTVTFALIAFMSYRIRNNFSPSNRVFLSTMYLLFPSCFHPIIYGVRTKEIREQFLKFMNQLVS
ncbi:olfactory receptor 52K1-like [Pangasianodon hypophthalmus]|uniref:olfactory receptor 52K1-like n=1 Tax=Pangasianodon hypophthalmus TaxID=310915 RepID=UPI001479863E|nr:olfactory receptor 52K1-like [Pangasianodon hypophthalmus]